MSCYSDWNSGAFLKGTTRINSKGPHRIFVRLKKESLWKEEKNTSLRIIRFTAFSPCHTLPIQLRFTSHAYNQIVDTLNKLLFIYLFLLYRMPASAKTKKKRNTKSCWHLFRSLIICEGKCKKKVKQKQKSSETNKISSIFSIFLFSQRTNYFDFVFSTSFSISSLYTFHFWLYLHFEFVFEIICVVCTRDQSERFLPLLVQKGVTAFKLTNCSKENIYLSGVDFKSDVILFTYFSRSEILYLFKKKLLKLRISSNSSKLAQSLTKIAYRKSIKTHKFRYILEIPEIRHTWQSLLKLTEKLI